MAGTSYRPQYVSNEDQPRKRQRVDEESEKSSRQKKRQVNKGGRPDAYRPNYKPQNRARRADSYHPNRKAASNTTSLDANSSDQTQDDASMPDAPNTNKKSKRERKENPSSRIHSLRKQLARNFLPPPIQAEKERELAALLFDQSRKKIRNESKRNLQRYHFIRFMERQKAQRILKQLRRSRDNGDKVDGHGVDLEERIKEAEIDFNYTIYAPLGEKYIGIFSEQDNKTGSVVSKAEKYKGNWKLMKPKDMSLLTDEQKQELQATSQDAVGILDMNVASAGEAGSRTGPDGQLLKPPMWWEVKAAMELDGEAGSTGDDTKKLSKLNAIRDRDRAVGAGSGTHESQGDKPLVVGLKAGNKNDGKGWLHDDGRIAPEDLDSESDADADTDMVDTARRDANEHDDDDDDDDMSDGDGGFFEKR